MSQATGKRIGQTIQAKIHGRVVTVECVGDDGRRIAWKAKDGDGAGEWDAGLWDINRRMQQETKGDG